MRIGSLYTMRRVNIGSFMYRVNESILLKEELKEEAKKSTFQKAIESDSIPDLKDMIETEIVDETDFTLKLEEQKNKHSFRTWLFNNKINSEDYHIKDLKIKLDTSFFRYIKKDGLNIDTGIMELMVGEGWINQEQADSLNPINIITEFYDNNPTHPDYV